MSHRLLQSTTETWKRSCWMPSMNQAAATRPVTALHGPTLPRMRVRSSLTRKEETASLKRMSWTRRRTWTSWWRTQIGLQTGLVDRKTFPPRNFISGTPDAQLRSVWGRLGPWRKEASSLQSSSKSSSPRCCYLTSSLWGWGSTLARGWPCHPPALYEHEHEEKCLRSGQASEKAFLSWEECLSLLPVLLAPITHPKSWDMTCSQEKCILLLLSLPSFLPLVLFFLHLLFSYCVDTPPTLDLPSIFH